MRKIIFTLLIGSVHLTGFSQTYISGFITANTVWDSIHDPYIITSNTLVTAGFKLTILPGTVIKFNSQKALQIDGELNVLGNDSARVLFTANNSTPQSGDWDAIIFSASSNGTVFDVFDGQLNYASGHIIKYADFEFGGGATPDLNFDAVLEINVCNVLIENTAILKSNSNGITFRGSGSGGTVKIINNTIKDCAWDGIFIHLGNSTKFIENNTITNARMGVLLNSTSNAMVKNNVIKSSSATQLRAYNGDNITISKNILLNGLADAILQWANITPSSIIIEENLIINNASLYQFVELNATKVNNNLFIGNTGYYGDKYDSWFPHQISNNQFIENMFQKTVNDPAFIEIQGVAAYGTSLNLKNNLFQDNTILGSSSGLIETSYPYNFSYTLTANSFFNNSAQYIVNNLNNNGSPNLSCQNNYWGTTNSVVIDQFIYDWFDEASKSFVHYSPFLNSPDTTTPISRPGNNIKLLEACNGPAMFWDPNPEIDIKGYKIYYGNFNGYEFEHSMDLGDTTVFYDQLLSLYDTVAITAYDNFADGVDDLTEGHESWYRFIKLNSVVKAFDLSTFNTNVFCKGDSMALIAKNYVSYLWSTTDTTDTIYIHSPGVYSVIVRDPNGISYCDSIEINWENIVLDLGSDTFLLAGQTLNLNAYTAGASYLWSNGSTTSSLSVNSDGTYWVKVTTQLGCIFYDTISIGPLGLIENNSINSFSIYPNPTNKSFNIKLSNTYEFIHLTLTDIHGKILRRQEYDHQNHITFDLNDLPQGLYMLRLRTDDEVSVMKIVKEE